MEQTAVRRERCGAAFALFAHQEKLVRRDFVDHSRHARVEGLCPDRWTADVEGFLGEEFDAEFAGYGRE